MQIKLDTISYISLNFLDLNNNIRYLIADTNNINRKRLDFAENIPTTIQSKYNTFVR